MNVGIMIHNLTHIAMPFLIVGLVSFNIKDINFGMLLLATFVGSYLPDLDHFSMWNKIQHKGLWNFIRIVMRAERYRRAFLPFHNFLSILILAVATPIIFLINLFVGIFLLAFLTHIILDFLADIFLIKSHGHWKIKSWI